MAYNLPPYVADWLTKYPTVTSRFETLTAQVPVLEAEQASRFASGQVALAAVKTAESNLQIYYRDVERRNGPSTKVEEDRLRRAISTAKNAASAIESNVLHATRVSHGTRVALERTASLIKKLNGADLELAKQGKPGDLLTQRNVLEGLDDDAEQVEQALQPSADCLARAVAELSAESYRGRLRVTAGGSLVWPEVPLPVAPTFPGGGVVSVIDTAALITSLNLEGLTAQIESAVERLYEGVPAAAQLTASEKRKRLDKIKALRLEAELVEVAAIFKAWSEGDVSVGLRADTDPMAVLGVRGSTPGEGVDGSLIYH